MIAALLARIGIKGAIVAGACLLFALMAGRMYYLAGARDIAEAKTIELGERLRSADLALRDAVAINGRMTAALQAQNTAATAARVRVETLELAASKAAAIAIKRDTADRAADRNRRARADLPPPDEMAAVLAEIMATM